MDFFLAPQPNFFLTVPLTVGTILPMEEYDFSADIMPVGDNLLAQISATADEVVEASVEVDHAEGYLKTAKSNLTRLTMRVLPELMAAAQQSKITTIRDLVVEVKNVLRASIPEHFLSQALKWLTDHGHESVIKDKITLSFGKGEAERAEKLCSLLDGWGFEYERSRGVHPQTLAALLRELRDKHIDFPMEIFGAVVLLEAKVTPKKDK